MIESVAPGKAKVQSTSMVRESSPVAFGVLAGVFYVLAIAAMSPNRHFFDDETINVYLLRTLNLGGIYRFAQSQDVHPPLSYLLNKVVYMATGSLQAILWGNAVLVAVAICFFVSSVARRLSSNWQKVGIATVVGLNPSLLLWGDTLRWYAYWLPLALIVFTILFVRDRTSRTLPVAAALAVILFYIGYLTIYFVVVCAILEWLRGGSIFSRRTLRFWAAGVLCILPQCYYLVTVHLPQGDDQTTRNALKLLGSAAVGTFLGPSIFPLERTGMIFTLVFALLAVIFVFPTLGSRSDNLRKRLTDLGPLAGFSALLLIFELLSGIAVKERNLALANVLVSVWVVTKLFDSKIVLKSTGLALIGSFLLLSTRNALLYRDTGKASMNLPIRLLLEDVEKDRLAAGVDRSQVYFVTWQDVLTCYGQLEGFHVFSPFSRGVDHETESIHAVIPPGSFVVFLGSQQEIWRGRSWKSALDLRSELMSDLGGQQRRMLGPDRFSKFESKMTGQYFPPYQIEYVSGKTSIPVKLDWIYGRA